MTNASKDLFKDKAADFDTNDIPRQLSAGIGATLLSQIALNNQMKVMDFGAGTGLISAQVASKVGHVTCVDVSESMLERLAAKEELRGKVEIICQDILQTPLGRTFDLIVSAMAMHHVRDTAQAVKRFAEHLEVGGQVALADLDAEDGTFHPPDMEGVYHAGFDRDAFAATLEKNGFRDVRFTTAHTVQKEDKRYSVFLAVATRA